MRTIDITIRPGSRFGRVFLISTILLTAIVWRMLKLGDDLFSTRVGLACCFVALAGLAVWTRNGPPASVGPG